jgi:hypothetical protein
MSVASDMVSLYIEAEKAVLLNQSYTLGGRTLTRANLQEIRDGRKEWQAKVDNETAGTQGGSDLYSVADFT